jgi:hypothetical protein
MEKEAAAPMIDQLKEHVNTYLAQHGTVIIETGDESEYDLSLRTAVAAPKLKENSRIL